MAVFQAFSVAPATIVKPVTEVLHLGNFFIQSSRRCVWTPPYAYGDRESSGVPFHILKLLQRKKLDEKSNAPLSKQFLRHSVINDALKLHILGGLRGKILSFIAIFFLVRKRIIGVNTQNILDCLLYLYKQSF